MCNFYLNIKIISLKEGELNADTLPSVYKNLTGNAGWVTLWEDKAQTLCDQNDIVQEDIDDLKDNLAVINEECNIQKFIKRKSEELYDELFHYWIEGT